jgi:TonB family protein
MTQFLDTLLAWSGQIFILVAVAAFAAITITHPKARLLFWQGILLLAILIPAIEPRTPTPIYLPSFSISTQPLSFQAAYPSVATTQFRWQQQDWLLIIAAGMALRLIWIAAGFLRLRAYRKQARVLSTPPLPFVSGAASWYESENVPGPVTYGWLRPSILLPTRVLALPPALREPIACHELIHVNRRDWLFVIAEEFLRSALWFHPAIWYVLSRIQLAREQVVDREVVRLTENRESYLDALVAVAEQSLLSDLAPAPLFLRKRQLAERVKEVLKEIPMSKSKLAANLAGACSVTLMAALAAMWLFPFMSPAQTVNDGPGVTVNPGAPLIHRTPIGHPEGTTMTGTVIVEATLNTKGEVTDAHVISGPDELRRTALTSVLQWHYVPGITTAQATINFEPALAMAVITSSGVRSGTSVTISADAPGGRGKSAAPAPAAVSAPAPNAAPIPAFPATVKAIAFDGIGPEAEQQIRSALPVREGSTVTFLDVANINDAIHAYDSHLSASFLYTATDANGRSMGLNVNPRQSMPEPLLPPAFAAAFANGRPEVTIRVQSQSAQAQFISVPIRDAFTPAVQPVPDLNLTPRKRVTPVYPDLAKRARIQGTVKFAATIAPDGTVSQLELISGHPLLVESAKEAVLQWVYAPSAAPVQTQVTVNFTLAE